LIFLLSFGFILSTLNRWIGCWIRIQLFLLLFVGDGGHDDEEEA
jgi:hypothetical protein